MKLKKLFLFAALLAASNLQAGPGNGVIIPLNPIKTTPINGEPARTPVVVPVFYIDGHTLTAGDYSVGSTVEIKDGDDVLFSTYIYIEGDITLLADLAGTYTIEVTRGDQRFIGEIEL